MVLVIHLHLAQNNASTVCAATNGADNVNHEGYTLAISPRPCAATRGADTRGLKLDDLGMPTPFSRFLLQAPEELLEVLREDNIGGHPVDAAIFLLLYDNPEVVKDWNMRIMDSLCETEMARMKSTNCIGRAL
jgi:hypothetical protein